MGMVFEKMNSTVNDYFIFLLNRLNISLDDIVILKNKTDNVVFSIDYLTINIEKSEILVKYIDECEIFLKDTYLNVNLWLNDAYLFIKSFVLKTIYIEYFYNKNNNELLYYKIWVVDKSGKKLFVKKIYMNINPIKFFCQKTVKTVIYNKSQGYDVHPVSK